MALFKCPECRNAVSDIAEVCPHCGYPIASYVRTRNKLYADGDWIVKEKVVPESAPAPSGLAQVLDKPKEDNRAYILCTIFGGFFGMFIGMNAAENDAELIYYMITSVCFYGGVGYSIGAIIKKSYINILYAVSFVFATSIMIGLYLAFASFYIKP